MAAIDPDIERDALTLVEAALAEPSPDRHVRDHAPSAAVEHRALALLSRSGSVALQTGGLPRLGMPTALPERIGSYRITGLIGQGGMGAVYRGERATGDFDHEVAIKLVRPGLFSEALTQRLSRERQTLARLSHPNIARLLDGGSTADGAPYIVMELVDGVPIDRWLEGDPPEVARISLFLAICDAVGFAHQNLIIHRDLTPSNVLVTPAGEPRLIDFGISRSVEPDADSGRSSDGEARSMTPGFAAPERRVPGHVATTLSDIYSLGRLLETLCAGTRDRDLRAIMAMATATDPAARYPSVGALAEDIGRWRNQRPVRARARDGGQRYVIGRFLARNRFGVAAAALALMLVLTALAATLVANYRAQAARAHAERRFAQTRAIAKTLIFDIYDVLRRTPGSAVARATVVRTGLRYLDVLAADRDAPWAVRVETGQGYARLADVIGTGASGTLGRMADSAALLNRAEAILTAAYHSRPADQVGRRALAALLVERSHVALFNDNDVPRATRAADQALALVGPGQRDAEAARIHAGAISVQGEALSWDEGWAAAKRRYLAAEAFIAALPTVTRADPALIRLRAMNLKLLAEAEHKLKDEPAARTAIDRAVALQEGLLAADPTDPSRRRSVVAANRYSAILYRANEQHGAARQAIARATRVARTIRDADPADAAAALLWLVAAEVEAQTLADLNRPDETIALGERIRREYRRLIALSGDAAGMHRNFYAALRTVGGDYYNVHAYAQACDAWREARVHLDWLAAKGDLTQTDRKGRRDVLGYLSGACDHGPPRPGLGPSI